jgi:hypothetical protein
MKKSYLPLFLAGLLSACSGGNQQKVDKLEAEVIAIHDEVMPKMGEIVELKAKLAEQMANQDSTKANYQQYKQKSDSLSNMLTDADNKMMDWMDEYNPDTLKALKPDQALIYLAAEKEKLEKLKTSTINSINAAKANIK